MGEGGMIANLCPEGDLGVYAPELKTFFKALR